MGWKSLFDGNLLRNGLIAAIVVMFVFQLGNDGPLIGGLILAAPFGITLVMVQGASTKETKRLAIISSAIALGSVFFILITASGFQAGIYILWGVMAVSSVRGLLFTLFGIMELTSRRRRRKRA